MPNDTITIFTSLFGNTTQTIVSGNSPKTIIGISMQQSKDLSDTWILCGTEVLAKNYAKDLPYVELNYQCSNDIKIQKTGQDESSIILNYLPYATAAYSTTTQYGYNPSTNISSSSDITIYGSMSAGEILIAFVLICMVFLKMLQFLIMALSKIQTHKLFLKYGGGDVEIKKEI